MLCGLKPRRRNTSLTRLRPIHCEASVIPYRLQPVTYDTQPSLASVSPEACCQPRPALCGTSQRPVDKRDRWLPLLPWSLLLLPWYYIPRFSPPSPRPLLPWHSIPRFTHPSYSLFWPLVYHFLALHSLAMSDPRVLFSLVPLGERAIEVVNDSINEGFVSYLGGHAVLDIGRCLSKSGGTTLATLGRDGDIAVRGSSISRIQCSFEINSSDNIVMFVDRSRTQSSQVFGDNATPFEYPRDRQIAVLPGVNNIIGMGGVGRDLVLFHLQWNTSSPHEAMERVKNMPTFDVNWRLVQTMINEPIFPSQRATRIHTSRPCLPKMRTVNLGRLGAGAFGEVDKVVDLDSGRLMAAKSLKQSPAGSEDSLFMQLKREVENLAKLSHVSKIYIISRALLLHELTLGPAQHCWLYRIRGLGQSNPQDIYGASRREFTLVGQPGIIYYLHSAPWGIGPPSHAPSARLSGYAKHRAPGRQA